MARAEHCPAPHVPRAPRTPPTRAARAARAARRLVALIGAVLLLGLPGAPALAAPVDDDVVVTVWWGDGCPRCEALRAWLDELADDVPVEVVEREVWHDARAREAFVAEGERLGFDASAVPTTVVGERVWIGFTDAIADDLAAAVRAAADGTPPAPGVYGATGSGTCDQPDATACTATEEPDPVLDVPLVGEVSLGSRSLLASTLVIGFVDGVNPCSLWAISVLLTIVVRTASRRRVLAVGGTFLGITAAMYGLFMAGIYSALSVVGWLGWVQAVVAVLAGVFGVVAVKDYFALRRGVSFSIPDAAKPGLYRRMRRAAGQERIAPALLATAALAVAVSLLETPCTAGFPVLWTGLLQANGVGPAEAVALFGAYMVPFLLDEVLVLAAAIATMRAIRMTERHGELLKLLAGVTMLALGAVMALDPGIMEDPVAAVGVLGGALALAAVVHVVTTRVRARRRGRSPVDAAPACAAAATGPQTTTVPPAVTGGTVE